MLRPLFVRLDCNLTTTNVPDRQAESRYPHRSAGKVHVTFEILKDDLEDMLSVS